MAFLHMGVQTLELPDLELMDDASIPLPTNLPPPPEPVTDADQPSFPDSGA